MVFFLFNFKNSWGIELCSELFVLVILGWLFKFVSKILSDLIRFVKLFFVFFCSVNLMLEFELSFVIVDGWNILNLVLGMVYSCLCILFIIFVIVNFCFVCIC